MKKLVVILVLAALLSSTTAGWAQQAAGPQPARLPRHAPGQTIQPGQAPGGLGAGSQGSIQAQVAKLTAADGEAGDAYGWTVSVDSDTAIVGSFATVGGNDDAGAVYVYYRNEGGPDGWGQVVKVTAADGVAGDQFGESVSVSGDTAVVGAPHAQSGGNADQGVAYVLYRDQGGPDGWGQVAKLTAADGAAEDEFGWYVSVSGDTAVVAAWLADVGGHSDQGAAYVFYRNQGGPDAWGQVAKLTASDGAAGDWFGWDLSLSGGTVVVSNPWETVGGNVYQGAAYVFDRDRGGADAWGQAAKLVAADGAPADYFGDSVALDGDTALAGADGADVGGNLDQGAAYIFYRNQGGPGAWGQVAKLTAADGASDDWFGLYPSVSGDAAVVGAMLADVGGNADQGAAYVFYRNQGGADVWGQAAKLSASDGASADQFGDAISVRDGTALIGAQMADIGGNADQGAAYVFALPALHVAGIEGHFGQDPYGRHLLRIRVAVHDQNHQPAGDVAVGASIWSPVGGPNARTRMTKPATGMASFPWGSSAAGAWTLCVDSLAKDGFLYAPAENDVPACASWNN